MQNPSQNVNQACSHTNPENNINTSLPNNSKRNAGIKNAITKAEKKLHAETKENDKMWGQIAKIVDVALSIEASGKIEDYQIQHIVRAISNCTLPKV